MSSKAIGCIIGKIVCGDTREEENMKRILQYAAAAVLTLCLCVLLGGGR